MGTLPDTQSDDGTRGQALVSDDGGKRSTRGRAKGGEVSQSDAKSPATDGDRRRQKTEPIISIKDLTKSFGSHTVLQDITFDVPKGRITAILGPSGTGKSVLLKNIIGLLRPERGEI